MKPYAEGTTVSVEKTKAELDALLGKHGATSRGVMSSDEEGTAFVYFAMAGERFQIAVPLPKLGDYSRKGEVPRHWGTRSDRQREEIRHRLWEQACRERWRTMLLLLKSKLELVRIGASTIRREFMADLVLANGKTVGELLSNPRHPLLLGAAENP